jgi:hypothetical protein
MHHPDHRGHTRLPDWRNAAAATTRTTEPPGEVRYERASLTYADIVRRWPSRLQAVRDVLPGGLARTGPPGIARYGTWVVVATVVGYPIGLAWSVPFAGDSRCAYIEEVAVLDAWQRLGVGTHLIV